MTKKFELFYNRLKEAINAKSDTDVWKYLEINKSTLSMWKSREKVDWELVLTKFEHADFNWLIKGVPTVDYIQEDNYVIELQKKHIERLEKDIKKLENEIEELKKEEESTYYGSYVAEPKPKLRK